MRFEMGFQSRSTPKTKSHHHANIIAYTGLITMGNPNITNELPKREGVYENENENDAKKVTVTDLWCEGVNDLGRKRFRELENKQDPDLSPWDGRGLPLKRQFRREEGCVLIWTRRNSLVTSCCGHNKEGRRQQRANGGKFSRAWLCPSPPLIMITSPGFRGSNITHTERLQT